ncbi:GMC oxidoreductase [Actinokineospora pegani]|uniref:GMC oxidoreductase n=1 Tax=Actinokineospora pegani TaxID=2654637 RepID=UPI0012E9E7BD|nr:GMC oxidoreductase [Actinokineospora pegani]
MKSTSPAGRGGVDREESHRVVIIGSGVGGSITAFRLAQAGIDNLVLERGRRWPITPDGGTFPWFPSLDKRLLWLDRTSPAPLLGRLPWPASVLGSVAASTLPRSTGLLDVSVHRNMTTVCGAGVGGGTLVYGAILPQPSPGAFHRVFPSGIDHEELDRTHYPRARRRLRAAPFPDDLLFHPRYRTNKTWHAALVEAGLPAEKIVSSIDFDVIRAELDGTKRPSATIGQYLFTGCDSGAKLSVDRTYLAEAEATGRTVVRPLHKVTGIGQHRDGRYHVTVDRLDVHGEVLERIRVVCERLVLAAGGTHTPRLLVTARATGALPRLNEFVGAQWGTNGDQMPVLVDNSHPESAHQGGPPSHFARNHDGTAMITHGGLSRPVGTRVLVCPGIGIPDRFGQWSHCAHIGQARLEWSCGSDTTTHRNVLDLMRRTAPHTGPDGATLLDPFAAHPLVLHPLGGAAIGKATDLHGRLHGHPGLYCLDSALMPGSTAAVNPVLTIAAIVERCLDHIMGDFTD